MFEHILCNKTILSKFLSVHVLFSIRQRNRFQNALHGAMIHLFGIRSNKLALFLHVKMYPCLTKQNLCTPLKTYQLHQLSTLVFKGYVEKKELQGEVNYNTIFIFHLCLSFLRSKISLLNFLNPWLLPFHGLLSAIFQSYLHRSRCISDQLLVALTIFFPIIPKFNNFPLPYNFFQDLFICVGILLFADFLAS